MSSREPSGFASQPETPGSRYTPEETIRLQEMFLPQSELYRRRQRHAAIAFLGGGGPFLGSLLLNSITHLLFDRTPIPQSWFTPLGIVCLISVIIGIGLLFATPALKCPACQGRVDGDISKHCPECGSDQIEWQTINHLQCHTCHKTLETAPNTTRLYRFHACTHCGLMLDYRGL